jgi:hypothetical protein
MLLSAWDIITAKTTTVVLSEVSAVTVFVSLSLLSLKTWLLDISAALLKAYTTGSYFLP